MGWYIVTTQRTDLKIHIDRHTDSHVIGGLDKGRRVWVVEVWDERPVGQWMKVAAVPGLNPEGWAYAGDRSQLLQSDDDIAPRAAAIAPPSPEHHTLLFFGGACPVVRTRHAMGSRFPRNSCIPGLDMRTHDAEGKTRTSQLAYEHFTSSGRFAHAPKWNPAVSSSSANAAVDAGLRFLGGHRQQGKLVIYGFSAGGFNAVQLCERITRQVDLLITVDPCIQDIEEPGRPFPIHRPGRHVVSHFNWYQTSEGEQGSEDRPYSGRFIRGAQNAPPQSPPRRRGQSSHDQMPVFTQDSVEEKIADVLGSPARALHVAP